MALENEIGGKRRIFVVDDEPAVRRGFTTLFNLQPDLEVCGEAEGATAALEQIQRVRPDLAVVDLRLQEGDGFTLIQQLRDCCPSTKILVCSMHREGAFARRAFESGAHGYLSKEEADLAVEAVRVLLQGGRYVSERLAGGGSVPRISCVK